MQKYRLMYGYDSDAEWFKREFEAEDDKEAVLKALGQGFAFSLDQVELGPDRSGALVLRRLGGSEALARGWHLRVQEMTLEGRPYLLALAQV